MTDRNIDTVLNGSEKELLMLFLQNQREILLWKVRGLRSEQLTATPLPSSISLIGLVKHLTRVERNWLQQDLVGPGEWSFTAPQDEWHLEPGENAMDVLADYREAIAASDEMVSRYELDTPLVDPHPMQKGVTLRWALMHMIEETARHVGHADMIREAIDGEVGQNERYR